VDDTPLLTTVSDGRRLALVAAGSWTVERADQLERLVDAATRAKGEPDAVAIDMRRLERLDTYGAWLFERLLREFHTAGRDPNVVGMPEQYRALLDEVHHSNRAPLQRRRENVFTNALIIVGKTMASVGADLLAIVQMFGAVTAATGRALLHPRRFRFTSMVHHIDRVGWRAVPIIVLITFLIGAIIAQQGIFHFRKFGADVFVVDMLGILVLREIGVLIVCIMVAGRSGSAYTAELGSMKMREEVDALRTMGFDPIDVLILPRLAALVIAVPLLSFLGAMAALYGGGLVCWLYGGMSPEIFLQRLREAITIDHFQVGMYKAPFMAMIIGIVATVEGLAVEGSAESLGLRTTSSVVKSIFLVIVLDGFFAIFFAAIGK
jgi:phospholipid/cholesterol/gamma-HCH transport system permease protein